MIKVELQPQLIKYWGYPIEEHWVLTEDGYILGMHRIPHGRNVKYSSKSKKQAVFLGHALLCDSGEWVFGPPGKSLGYILADEGRVYFMFYNVMKIFTLDRVKILKHFLPLTLRTLLEKAIAF